MLQMELHNTESTWELLYSKSKAEGSFCIRPLKFGCKDKAPQRETSSFRRAWVLTSFWHVTTYYIVRAHKPRKLSHSPISPKRVPKKNTQNHVLLKKNQTKNQKTYPEMFSETEDKNLFVVPLNIKLISSNACLYLQLDFNCVPRSLL